MARIRTIKPEFWLDEDLAEVSEPALLLAIGLLNYSDDDGYFKAHAGLLKAQVFPLRELSATVPVLLQELSSIGYIRLFFGSDGKEYGAVINFRKHQVISKYKESKIKELEKVPEQSSTTTGKVLGGKERKGKEPRIRNQEMEGGKEGKGKDISVDFDETKTKTRLVFEYWQSKLNHSNAKLDEKRKKKILQAFKLGYTVEDCQHAIHGCFKSSFHMGENQNGTVYDDITLIFRDAEHIEKFINFYHNPPKPQSKANQLTNGNISAAQQAAETIKRREIPV